MPAEKYVAITGTSKGLGEALARRLDELGHHIFGGARTPLESLAQEPPGRYERVDTTESSSLDNWWSRMTKAWGRLPDVVVANAAVINKNAPLWEVPEREFRAVMEANVTGVFLTLKQFLTRWHALPKDLQHPAVLVVLSSGWGRSTSADVAPYCTSKWALEGMVGALSQELPTPLSVVSLNPGIIDTDMLRSCFGTSASRFGRPEQWAVSAADQILGFGRSDNGAQATVS